MKFVLSTPFCHHFCLHNYANADSNRLSKKLLVFLIYEFKREAIDRQDRDDIACMDNGCLCLAKYKRKNPEPPPTNPPPKYK